MQAETESRLNERLAREQSEQRLPSVTAGVVRDGELVWSGFAGRVIGSATPTPAFPGGPATSDVQYRCGSITKTFVAVQVMRLRDEGRLDLSDPLERHLPGAFDGVTIAQLLSHSAGLRAETAGPWWERTAGGDFADLTANSLYPRDDPDPGALDPARLTRPARRFHYSNVGFAVLGELVSRMRQAPWIDAVREELLLPLGMLRTTPRPQPPHAVGFAVHPYADVLLPEPEHDAGAMAPAGQLWTTVGDLARWMAFLAGHTPSGASLLAPATLAEMREPQAVDDRPGAPWTGAWGLGLQIWNADGVRSFGHGGSMPGFLALVRINESSRDGSVILANSTAGMRPTLAGDLEQIFAQGEPRPVREWLPAAPADDILPALGTWFWGPSAYRLRAVGSGELALESEPAGGRSSRFHPRPDGTWVGLEGYYAGETLRFVRDESSGPPVAIDLASFIFTRTPYDPDAEVPGGVHPQGWHAPETDELA